MKWIAPVVLLSTALAYAQAPAQTATPRQRPVKQYTMEQFLDTTSIQGASFSADESRILFSSNKTGIWNAYTVPITGGVWTPITKVTRSISKHTGDANYEAADFDTASKYLYFLTDNGGEFTALKRYALADGKVEDVQSAPWHITQMTFSHNGKYRATIVNNDGRPAASVMDTATGSPVPLPAVPNAGVAAVRFSPSETKLALSISGDRSPNNLYTLDLATKKVKKLT